jgi:putative ribosome biogenesis GTPase RsgA
MELNNTINTANAVIKAFETAQKQGWFDILLNLFRKKHYIVVFGSTGVGKTNLIESLTQENCKRTICFYRYAWSRNTQNQTNGSY